MAQPGLHEFSGTERFSIQRRLGSGAFGVVYQALDRDRNAVVALKTLLRVDPAAIYRFKQEFRALADVTHRNLVELYELMSDGEQWFFSMELVDGVSFIDYVTEGRGGPRHVPLDASTISRKWPSGEDLADFGRLEADPSPEPEEDAAPKTCLANVDKLRRTLAQLAAGLSALHRTGKLHRDIKPHNVLVTPQERVVLLDFGLSTELHPLAGSKSSTAHAVGTPAYMSPEQAAGLPLSEASDWYSVGSMLFEALAGRLPFVGRPLEVMMKKQGTEPPPPAALVSGVPEDLDILCRDLLQREEERRPLGEEVVQRLAGALAGAGTSIAPVPPRLPSSSRSSPSDRLFGREGALGVLREAFETTRAGRAVTVHVTGSAGTGKSALVRHFLKELEHQARSTVVLAGRCYERESVPYKALDSLVDALSHYLKTLPALEAEVLLPRDVLALARIFPVLRRVEAISGARRRVPETPDSQELRRRAFAALRELLARLTDRESVLLYIDDLQWGDLDSAALLADLLSPPDPPALLLIASYRSEERETSPLVRALRASATGEIREVSLDALSEEDALDMALAHLGDDGAEARELARVIARESRGNPFFLDELIRHSQAGPHRSPARGTTLEEVVLTRVSHLAEPARRHLELICVAGGPVERAVLAAAAGASGNGAHALALLRAARLVRSHGARDRERVETYHDLIRETLVADLSPDTIRSHHLSLALALEQSGREDPEALASHFHGAGDLDRAAEYMVRAADRASSALAFDGAARLYRTALEIRPVAASEARPLRVKLGDALVNAGRGFEAAEAYLSAVEGARSAEALELRRRAAERFLVSGHIDRGMAALKDVLSAVGMQLAGSPRRAVLSLLAHRLFLAIRGLGFRERDATQVSAEELMRVDICWSVAAGIAIVDNVRGSEFQARHLLLALRAGEPYRAARALAMEVGYTATGGWARRARTERLRKSTHALAERVGHPHAIGLITFISGLAAYLQGRWAEAHETCMRAEEIWRERCTGASWELGNAQLYQLRSLYHLGRFEELSRRLPAFLKDVRERGDLYAETNLSARTAYLLHLAADEPEQARQQLHRILGRWSREGYHLQHYLELHGLVEVELYNGAGQAAWQLVEERWPAFARSLFQRIELIDIESRHLHARAAVAAYQAGDRREALLEVASKDAANLESRGAPWARPLGRIIRAAVLAARGDDRGAVSALSLAETELQALDMSMYVLACHHRRGELTPGEAGRHMVAEADAAMRAQKVKNPERMLAMEAPGFRAEGAEGTRSRGRR